MQYVIRKSDSLYHEAKHPRRHRRLWIDEVRGAQGFGGGTGEIPPGSNNPYHTHETEEIMFIYKGTGIALIEGSEHRLEPETMVYVPPGVRHQFRNTGTEDLCFVYFYVPGGPEQGLRRLVEQEEQ